MSSKPMISVIIPIYNTENYLHKCIESLLTQTFKDFELILIDDGSKDNSISICREFAAIDNRIRIFSKANGGVSSARNFGIDQALGKYITFVDSDDWVEDDFLMSLLPENHGVDDSTYIISGILSEYNGQLEVIQELKSDIYNRYNFSSLFMDANLFRYGYTVAKVYKRDVLMHSNLRFNENTSYTEDLLFMLNYISYVDKIKLVPSYLYHYVIHDYGNTSLSSRYYSYEAEKLVFDEFKRISEFLSKEFELTGEVIQKAKEELGQMLFRVIYSLYRPKYKKNKDFRLNSLDEIKIRKYRTYLQNIKGKDRLIMNGIVLNLFSNKNLISLDVILKILFRIRYNIEKISHIIIKSR